MSSENLQLSDFGTPEDLGIHLIETRHSAIKPHTHSFYELVYIKSGFCLHETGNVTELLLEGDFFVMKPGQWHRYVGPHAVELYNCMFSEKVLLSLFPENEYTAPLRGKNIFFKLHLDIAGQKRELRLLREMLSELQMQQTFWEIRLKSLLGCLLVDYVRTYEKYVQPRSPGSVYPNYVAGALEIISARYQDKTLSVAGVAQLAGVTPDYLSRQFRYLTGVGVQEYIRRFRLSKATELLLGGVSVSDTCQAVGFTNLCHFSREFKRELGVSPTQYTKQNA